MKQRSRRQIWLVISIVVGALAVLLVCAFAILNARLTTFVESDKFRAAMEKETAKGLHFPAAHYEPIKRTAMWTVETAEFRADDGRKALRATQAHGMTRA